MNSRSLVSQNICRAAETRRAEAASRQPTRRFRNQFRCYFLVEYCGPHIARNAPLRSATPWSTFCCKSWRPRRRGCTSQALQENINGIRGLQLGGVGSFRKGSAAVVVRGVLARFRGKGPRLHGCWPRWVCCVRSYQEALADTVLETQLHDDL